MNYKRLYSKIIAASQIIKGWGKPSFSQVGEDRILDYLFASLGVKHPVYLDIGANHPIIGSNTYFFYQRGSKGVCVEPSPALYNLIKKIRPKDICINAGIGFSEVKEADFYIFPESGWNTFSKEEVEYRRAHGQLYEKIISMALKNINSIIEKNFQQAPDFISIDVEGLDFDILKSLDFFRFAPKVLLVETIRFGDTDKQKKQGAIIDFVLSKGYSIYADTFVNTIFLRTK
jgi:FkbM family methyltransferase